MWVTLPNLTQIAFMQHFKPIFCASVLPAGTVLFPALLLLHSWHCLDCCYFEPLCSSDQICDEPHGATTHWQDHRQPLRSVEHAR